MRMRMMIRIERCFELVLHCLKAPLSWEVARSLSGSQRLQCMARNLCGRLSAPHGVSRRRHNSRKDKSEIKATPILGSEHTRIHDKGKDSSKFVVDLGSFSNERARPVGCF